MSYIENRARIRARELAIADYRKRIDNLQFYVDATANDPDINDRSRQFWVSARDAMIAELGALLNDR